MLPLTILIQKGCAARVPISCARFRYEIESVRIFDPKSPAIPFGEIDESLQESEM